MQKDIVVVSNNAGKIKEFKKILKDYNVLSLKDINLNIDVVEDGTTFEENAILKVNALKDQYDYVIADDSGLEISALNNQPGVYSARFLGEETPYSEKNEIVIDMLKDKVDRSARFVSVIAYSNHGKINTFMGELVGLINDEAVGTNGFGYDPIFYLSEFDKTLAEINEEEKNKISHRAKALAKFKEYIDNE